ncbi:histidine phosphatase superfamily [Chytridium lagenaria]|nr:histidine phosphatase superfamily [Chytridium lagenaria]
MVARHGTRNPSNGDVTKQIALKSKLSKIPLKNTTYAFLGTFQPPATVETASYLSLQGVKDNTDLASRIKSNYPTLISNPSLIYWQSTNVSRTIASSHAFIESLFSSKKTQDAAKQFLAATVVPTAIDADLRPYDACAAYINAIWSKAQFGPIATRISNLVGTTLTIDDITTLFNLCSFEVVLEGKTDNFCSLFTESELALYDYQQDLKNVNEGYALPLNEVLACSFYTSLINTIDAKISGQCDAPTASFKFAHEETILPVITALGLNRDAYALTPTTPLSSILTRQFRLSTLGAMGANVMFELLKCGDGYSVRVLVNEVVVDVPGCGEVCGVDRFKEVLGDLVGCDFDGGVCGNTFMSVGAAGTFKRLKDMPFEDVMAAIERED